MVLACKYACDQSIVALLRARITGNSPTVLCHNLQEVHSEEWLKKQLCYLTDCRRHRSGLQRMGIAAPDHPPAAPVHYFPVRLGGGEDEFLSTASVHHDFGPELHIYA